MVPVAVAWLAGFAGVVLGYWIAGGFRPVRPLYFPPAASMSPPTWTTPVVGGTPRGQT